MRRSNYHRRRGFTLIEVLMVLVILVIIMGLAVGNYTNSRKEANKNATKSQIGLFQTPLEMYQLDVGSFPSSLDGLRSQPSDVSSDKWHGPYLNKDIPTDPWGHTYQYTYPGRHNSDSYDIWSMGPDGSDGTSDDIGNWTTK